jgi:hypothetical protein
MMKTISLFGAFMLTSAALFSQTDNLFWFAAPDVSSVHGEVPKNGAPINLHVVADEPTTVTVSQPANIDFTPIVFQLNARERRSIRLDTCITIDQIENYPQFLPVNPANAQKKAFKITSNPGNVSVYYELDNYYNRELFTLKGRNAMGKHFFVSTQNQFPNGAYSNTAWSGFVIAATENNTRIAVYPNDDWYGFDTNPGDSIILSLNAGETFVFRAASVSANRHINGVPVKSDKDIVITFYDDSIGKKMTNSNNCSSNFSYDIIGDQLIPVTRTGKEYIIVKGQVHKTAAPACPDDGGESIFITSTQPNTEIIIDGQPVTTMSFAGQVISYPIDSAAVHLFASKPVYVIHLTGFGGELGAAVLPSVENCSGSDELTFTRVPNTSDVLMLNLTARNKQGFYAQSIDAFAILNDQGWTSIPGYYFEYTKDSSFVVLKKTPEVNAFITGLIGCGEEVVMKNYVTGFQLGMICGGASTGVKYGYLSGFSPVPVKPMPTKDSLEVVISTEFLIDDWYLDELLVLKITDASTNTVWYDTSAVVTKADGFRDTLYLDAGTYKCEILEIGANVAMPEIRIDDNHIVPWGYPDYEYYLFTIPGTYNTAHTIWEYECDSLVSPSGKYTWFTEGIYYDTIPNAAGFDSLLTVHLNISHSTSSVLNETACFRYYSPAGNVIENSGIYHEVIPNAAGCDSNITINLTVVKLDNSVDNNAGTLNASETNADYQWLACASGLDIEGATAQSYVPVVSGLYAVRIKKDGCTVTSNCETFTGILAGISEEAIKYYPNPVNGELFIEFESTRSKIELRMDDMSGRPVFMENYSQKQRIQVGTKDLSPGVYFVKLLVDGKPASFKVIR